MVLPLSLSKAGQLHFHGSADSVDGFGDGRQDLHLQLAFFIQHRAGPKRLLLGVRLRQDVHVISGIDAGRARLVILIRIAQVGDVLTVLMARELEQGAERPEFVGRRSLVVLSRGDGLGFHQAVVIDLGEGKLLGIFFRRIEYILESIVMVRIRMGDDDRERRGRRTGFRQIEPPSQETEHVVGLSRIDQEMLVVRGDDMATVPLPYVDEIHFKRPLVLHFLDFDIAIGIAAMHLDIRTGILPVLDRLHIVAAVLVDDPHEISEKEFLDKHELVLLRLGVLYDVVQLDGRKSCKDIFQILVIRVSILLFFSHGCNDLKDTPFQR